MNIFVRTEERIRMEAASQAINKTIRRVEERLNIFVPPVGSPTQRRDQMIDILDSLLRNR